MKVHILDDWFDTLQGLPCFRLLDGHEVTVWTDHEADEAALAARLQDADALVLFRERTNVTRGLLALLWQIFIWALFDELFTVRASYWWGFRECVEDGLPDGWHGRLRGWSGDSFFPVPRP